MIGIAATFCVLALVATVAAKRWHASQDEEARLERALKREIERGFDE
ncbi:MAG: hypothetical protein AAF196_07635 [Planctomycetota bacterium]